MLARLLIPVQRIEELQSLDLEARAAKKPSRSRFTAAGYTVDVLVRGLQRTRAFRLVTSDSQEPAKSGRLTSLGYYFLPAAT